MIPPPPTRGAARVIIVTWAGLAAGVGLAACGADGPRPYRDGDCYIEQRYEVTGQAVSHACLHLDEGPFDSRVAAAGQAEAEALTQSHTAYTIELASDGGAVAPGGYVRFTSEVATAYSFYFDGLTPVEIVDEAGARLCPATRHGLDDCDGLGLVEVHELAAGQVVWIAFDRGDRDQATVVLERY